MSDELKKRHAASLLKASDILVKLAQGTLEPVCLRKFEKDGSEVFVYAHANGVFELEKSAEGILTVGGYTINEHKKICMAAQAGIRQFAEMKDSLLKTGDISVILDRHATMLKLKKTLEDSKGAADVINEYLVKAGKVGRPPVYYPEDEQHAEEMAGKRKFIARRSGFGKAKFFRDRVPENDPDLEEF